MNQSSNREIVRKCYLEFLNREPDPEGWDHYTKLMEENTLDVKLLTDIFKNSDEYQKTKKYEDFTKKQKFIFQGKYDIYYNIHPNSVLDNIIVTRGIYDDFLIRLLSKLIPTDSTSFDIGANAGFLSLPFAKILSPKGTVHCFEPDLEIFSFLLENIKINNLTNIVCNSFALQNNHKLKKIILNKRRAIHDDGRKNTGLSTIEPNPTYVIGAESVSCSTVDNYVKENSIKQVDLLKIDVEGGDSKVLFGSAKTIEHFSPIIIYEFSPEIDHLIGISNTRRCFDFLNSKGYVQYQITNDETINQLSDYDGIMGESNILCIPNTIKLETIIYV